MYKILFCITENYIAYKNLLKLFKESNLLVLRTMPNRYIYGVTKIKGLVLILTL
jgi:hypothetical protein